MISVLTWIEGITVNNSCILATLSHDCYIKHTCNYDDNYRSYASGLPAQITASLTIGLTGMPFSGSDIG